MSAARTERLLNLLTLLLNTRRPISLSEIREHPEFEAYKTEDPKSGERAFERDKAALVELGVPLRWVPPEQDSDEDGLGGYMIDRERYYLPRLDLSPAELALLSIAGSAAAAIEGFPGRAAVIRALAKLGFDVSATEPPTGFAHTPSQTSSDPERVGAILKVLHDAVSLRRVLKLCYQDKTGTETVRTVNPFGLFYRQGSWYLVAFCNLRKAERTFHLSRIKSAEFLNPEKTSVEFEVPDTFDLKTHVEKRPWEYPKDPVVEVVIRLAPRLVPAIPEIFGPKAVHAKSGQVTQVTLKVTHRAALIAAVLPYGADAEVLSPKDLRAEIAGIYKQLAKRYQFKAGRKLSEASL